MTEYSIPRAEQKAVREAHLEAIKSKKAKAIEDQVGHGR
jgi:hypothetical protein